MKKHISRALALLIASVMMLAMTVSSFAVSGAADSDKTDYNTNRTGNSTEMRQANSSNTGTIRLGKILTVNQSGKDIPQSEMPKPATSNTAHHRITGTAPDSMRSKTD